MMGMALLIWKVIGSVKEESKDKITNWEVTDDWVTGEGKGEVCKCVS